MAQHAQTNMNVNGVVTVSVNTATSSDTLNYVAGANQVVKLDNVTGGTLTAVIKGTNPPSNYYVPSTGMTIDLSAGFSIQLLAGQVKSINLDKISAYLSGTGVVTITGATGIKVTILV